ncbi:MAG: peptidylprolyl isomerase [Chthoniobacterales bacterium]|nr:peptidylprolyl isomerase [Chthoniobacterales bacterium]
MANNPNSATSQWFINLADNSHTIDPNTHQDVGLDVQNGGFTVFGRVAGSGMSVVDNIALVPRYNFGSPLDSIPLRSYDTSKPIKLANLVSIPAITVISPLVYSAQSDKPAVASVIIGTSGTHFL